MRLLAARLSEAEDKHERFVDGAELVRVEAAGGTTKPLRIHDRRLRRGRRDEHGTETAELIGLDDHCVASAACS